MKKLPWTKLTPKYLNLLVSKELPPATVAAKKSDDSGFKN